MITVDSHSHSRHSHAADTVAAMCRSAHDKGMAIFGLSEHSLRPEGYIYPTDYQEKLAAGFPDYIREVGEEADRYQGRMQVLLALELDFVPARLDHAVEACAAYDYDYVIGGLHFQDAWGFDYSAADWADMELATCYGHFARYYQDLAAMARTGLFQIAAHPDLVKLFRKEAFDRWLEKDKAREVVRAALEAMRDTGMAMEISSAAIRKGLGEPYPGPVIMEMARELKLPVSFGSDAHAVDQVALAFDRLASYAASFGYRESAWFSARTMHLRPFI